MELKRHFDAELEKISTDPDSWRPTSKSEEISKMFARATQGVTLQRPVLE